MGWCNSPLPLQRLSGQPVREVPVGQPWLPREDAWDVQGCLGDALRSGGGCATPECAAVLPRLAEGSWGLAESAACSRMRAEKERQRREVVCSELYAEIISVWMSRLGSDGAVGD